jgi:hypothetical protein
MTEKKKLEMTTVVIQADGLKSADIHGEKVMMVAERGKYYGLDNTGARIWDLLEEQRSVSELVELLMDEFAVDRETCQSDVLELLNNMFAEGLVSIV